MDNLNIGFLVSSVLATTGLGVYVYMNNNDVTNDGQNDVQNDNHPEYANNEDYNADAMFNNESIRNENDSYNVKSNKKSVTVKTKRRNNKLVGTRRKRW
jgi:hypothetical protein